MTDLWGERVGTARLCDDDGIVRSNPDYPDGYACTGGHHVAYQRYIQCDNPCHVVQVATYSLLAPASGHCVGCSCGVTFQLTATTAAAHTYTATCAGHHPLTDPCPGA